MIRGFRRSAFSATSSDLLRAWSITVPKMSEVVDGCVQLTKQCCKDLKHMRIERLMRATG
jgi:hypothetical protein